MGLLKLHVQGCRRICDEARAVVVGWATGLDGLDTLVFWLLVGTCTVLVTGVGIVVDVPVAGDGGGGCNGSFLSTVAASLQLDALLFCQKSQKYSWFPICQKFDTVRSLPNR